MTPTASSRGHQAAHTAGILHRDIKPANVLMRADDGQPVITDFGPAKALDEESGLTKTGQILGTPVCMAPEQAISRKDAVDARSDVYSLGATLYELWT